MLKLCIKCGNEGHTNRNCKGPVTSFGLIVYSFGKSNFPKGRLYPSLQTECKQHQHDLTNEKNEREDPYTLRDSVDNEILFLLVERKDTVGFLNIVQGSYPDAQPYRSKRLQRYLNELTCEERKKLITWSFEDLWTVAGSDKKDVKKAEMKFKDLNVEHLVNSNPCMYKEADYLMPKGRLKFAETTRQCAMREFAEETGYNRHDVILLDIPPYIEQFTGTDGKPYRNVFYVAQLKDTARIQTRLGDDPNQSKEVRNLGWFNLQDSLTLMRDYHQDKKDILQQAHSVVENMLLIQAAYGMWGRSKPNEWASVNGHSNRPYSYFQSNAQNLNSNAPLYGRTWNDQKPVFRQGQGNFYRRDCRKDSAVNSNTGSWRSQPQEHVQLENVL